MSRFLYRLTQEIVTSRNFSDSNINRICSKYYESASFPDKVKLGQVVTDLKRKLQVHPEAGDSIDRSSVTLNHCTCDSPRRRSSKSRSSEGYADKSISTQSFLRVPAFGIDTVDSYTQVGESQMEVRPSQNELSRTSISTISSYNFPSSMYSELESPQRRRSSGIAEGADSIIISGEYPPNEPTDGCCKSHGKDSSADLVMRLAASSRPVSERKCPLHRCHQFERLSANSAYSGGECSRGCGSDFPLPPLAEMDEADESATTTCCGRRRKKKKKKIKIDTRAVKGKKK